MRKVEKPVSEDAVEAAVRRGRADNPASGDMETAATE